MDLERKLAVYGTPTPLAGGLAVVRHPLGDEVELLTRLGMEPEQCNSVDLYWVYKGIGYFISVAFDIGATKTKSWTEKVGPFKHKFYVQRPEPFGTSKLLAQIMTELANSIRA